jgi:hypothetical protein
MKVKEGKEGKGEKWSDEKWRGREATTYCFPIVASC